MIYFRKVIFILTNVRYVKKKIKIIINVNVKIIIVNNVFYKTNKC